MLRKDKITLYKIIIYNAINIPRFLKNKNHVLYYCRRNFNRKKKNILCRTIIFAYINLVLYYFYGPAIRITARRSLAHS